MSVSDRIAGYRRHRWIACSDSRWESVLADLQAGLIRIVREPKQRMGLIVVVEVEV